MASVADKPWLKAYDFGVFKIPETLRPYPNVTVDYYVDRNASEFPDIPAINFMERIITNSELKDLTDRFANALSHLGVMKGDRVATLLPNCSQFLISDFGILKAGACHVPCSVLHKPAELLRDINTAGIETVICSDTSLDLLRSIKDRTKVRNIIVTSALDYSPGPPELIDIPGTMQFRKLLSDFEPRKPDVEMNVNEDLAECIFTGGTTGVPKGVMLTHANKVANLHQSFSPIKPFEEHIRGKASYLISTPLYHITGHHTSQFALFMTVQVILVPDPRDIDNLKALLEKHVPTICSCVPTQYAKLVQKGLSNLPTAFTSSTAALPEETSRQFKESTGSTISDNYGMSEAGGVTHSNLAVSALVERKKPGSIGVPVPDTEVKIIDLETGNEAADGKEGEMWIRGPQIMKGYWPTPGSGLVDGWLPTGDVVRMDDDGYFYITARIKDMANVSGMKVYSILVEQVLNQHPGVAESAAVAVPDAERPGSDRVKAFIVLKNGYEDKVTPDEIIQFCRERLAPYEVPRYIEFRKELPRSPIGKVLKRQLRDNEG
jgi:long-chain acyl-CoA synthetase